MCAASIRAPASFASLASLAFVTSLASLVAACASTSSAPSAGGADAACGEVADFSCNVAAHARLFPFDEARGCIAPDEEVADVCESTSLPRCASASIDVVCAFDPAGGVWMASLRGDEDLTGSGWRFTQHRSGYGPALPPLMRATDDDEKRCASLLCAPRCSPSVALAAPCADAGADASR
jgi:hypothetical protein